jgi:hypothetical protein
MSHQDKEYAAKVLQALITVRSSPNPKFGICNNVRAQAALRQDLRVDRYWRHTSWEAFEAWEEFSGCPVHPVPSYCKGRDEAEAYDRVASAAAFWSKRTEYHLARWRLLDHLIKWYGEKAAS